MRSASGYHTYYNGDMYSLQTEAISACLVDSSFLGVNWAVHGVSIGTSPEQHFRLTFFFCADTDCPNRYKIYTQRLALCLSHLPLEVDIPLCLFDLAQVVFFDVKNPI